MTYDVRKVATLALEHEYLILKDLNKQISSVFGDKV